MRGAIATTASRTLRSWSIGLLGVATISTGVILVAPARADISCPSGFTPPNVNPDWYVVQMTEKFMAAHNLYNSRGAEGITAAAHQMCDDMDASGRSILQEAIYQSNRSTGGLSMNDYALLVGYAAAGYCPWDVNRGG